MLPSSSSSRRAPIDCPESRKAAGLGLTVVLTVVLCVLSSCTTVVRGQPTAAPYSGGPTALATPVLFRPVTETANPASTDDCPADPQASPRDSVTAPDTDNEQCFPLGPAILELAAVADLSIVSGVSGPALLLTLIEENAATMATYTSRNQGQQVAFMTQGVVLVAPVIQGPISGPIQLEGGFERAELEELIETLVDG